MCIPLLINDEMRQSNSIKTQTWTKHNHLGLLVCDNTKKTIEIADSAYTKYSDDFRNTLIAYGDKISKACFGSASDAESFFVPVKQSDSNADCGPLYLLSMETACEGSILATNRIDLNDLRFGQVFALENRSTKFWTKYVSPSKAFLDSNREPLDPQMLEQATRNLEHDLQ